MSDYPMLISNKLHSFRNFVLQKYAFSFDNKLKNIIFVFLNSCNVNRCNTYKIKWLCQEN